MTSQPNWTFEEIKHFHNLYKHLRESAEESLEDLLAFPGGTPEETEGWRTYYESRRQSMQDSENRFRSLLDGPTKRSSGPTTRPAALVEGLKENMND